MKSVKKKEKTSNFRSFLRMTLHLTDQILNHPFPTYNTYAADDFENNHAKRWNISFIESYRLQDNCYPHAITLYETTLTAYWQFYFVKYVLLKVENY